MNRAIIVAAAAGLLAAAAGCNGWVTPAGEITASRGVVTAVRVHRGPTVDGTLKCPIWQKCPPLVLGDVMSDQVGELKSTARVLFDKTHLYVGWECLEPDTSRVKADVAERDANVWNDDYVDLFVTADARVGSYHFLINSLGTLLDAHIPPDGGNEDTAWNSTAVVKASVEKNKRWVVTMKVPLKELGAYIGEGQTWPMNLNRTRPLGSNQFVESSWSSTGRSQYSDPSGWGKIVGVRIVPAAGGVTRTDQPPAE